MEVENSPQHVTDACFARSAQGAVGNNYSIFPIPAGQKRTRWRGWTKWCSSPPTQDQIARWAVQYPHWSVAFACGSKILAVDIDELAPERADALHELTVEHLGATPLIRIGQAPKRVLVYRVPSGCPIDSRRVGAVEVLATGRYFVGIGIHPKTRQPYRWPEASPLAVAVSELPLATVTKITAFIKALQIFYDIQADPLGQQEGAAAAAVRNTPASVRTSSSIIRVEGRVVDGRDAFLAGQVYRAYAEGYADAEAIAAAAWRVFEREADLSRPRRDGARAWSLLDAFAKAKALLARGKPRPRRLALQGGGETSAVWSPDIKQAFMCVVDAAGARGKLSPATVAVSHDMLEHVGVNGTCFASTHRLATRLQLSIDTVKKARRLLRLNNFWIVDDNIGGRHCVAHYRPNLKMLPRKAVPEGESFSELEGVMDETVDDPSTRDNQGEGDTPQEMTMTVTSVFIRENQIKDRKNILSSEVTSLRCREEAPQGAASDVLGRPR